ncbi:MAG: M48 family metallopeptidase [Candidatus Lambdaproteobacteria bacterium]|nr:M48 family metallopeptidase [Candidatus Lambdaproteobacteria bacterium]
MTATIPGVVAALLLLRWAIEAALGWLNLRHTARPPALPPELSAGLPAQEAARSRAYTLARQRLALLSGAVGLALTLALLYSGVLPALDGLVGRWGLPGLHLAQHRSAAFLVALAALTALVGLPFRLYLVFGIEARFGFNRITWRLWLLDRLKGLALAALLGLPLLYAVLTLIASGGRGWWLSAFALLAAWQLAVAWVYPTWIAPLFNRFTPLEAGDLRSRVEALAAAEGFRPRGIFVMDASRRSTHSNAYFTGLRRPRIVLFDTLLRAMSADELLSVLAHELGHYRALHVWRGLALSLAGTLAGLYVLSLLLPWPPLYAAFGFAAPSAHAGLALVMLAGGGFTFALGPALAWLSRRQEYQADAFAVRALGLPAALKSALVRLNRENLANPLPHPWYSRYHYSHPTLLERLAAIDRLAPVAARLAPPLAQGA